MTDFDPLHCPPQFAKWLEKATPEEREKHATIWTKRAMAAVSILKAVAELEKAFKECNHETGYEYRLGNVINEAESIARELHDYDPTSD